MSSQILGPGTYPIILNAQSKPIFAMHLEGDPVFETTGPGSFIFEIEDPTDVLAFTEDPITWCVDELQIPPPTGNSPSLDGKRLTLSVQPTDITRTFHFTLHFNLGDIGDQIWSTDGSRLLDPTIVEKPDEGPSVE